MAEVREIRTVVEDEKTSSTLAVFLLAIVAIAVVGLLMWQPWATAAVPAPTRETTIIQQPAENKPDTTIINPPSNTTIVNPPANPPKTEININGSETGGTTGE